jgi:hypothetical protein
MEVWLMAPLGNIASLNRVKLTSQQIADLMLSEDQARRRALMAGDLVQAAIHDAEIDRLARLLPCEA